MSHSPLSKILLDLENASRNKLIADFCRMKIYALDEVENAGASVSLSNMDGEICPSVEFLKRRESLAYFISNTGDEIYEVHMEDILEVDLDEAIIIVSDVDIFRN